MPLKREDDRRLAEEVDGLGAVPAEKAHRQQVEQDFVCPPEAIFALACHARVVRDHHLRHARACPRRVDGDEAVHLAVERVRLEDHAAVGLEGAAVVVQVKARDLANETVGDEARKLAAHGLVLAVLAPAGDDVVPLVELLQHRGDVGRVVLQVGVERDDDAGARVVDAGGECRGLPVVATKAHEAHPGARRAASPRTLNEPSRLPSSTITTSTGCGSVGSVASRASNRRGSDSSSLNTGMMRLTAGVMLAAGAPELATVGPPYYVSPPTAAPRRRAGRRGCASSLETRRGGRSR